MRNGRLKTKLFNFDGTRCQMIKSTEARQLKEFEQVTEQCLHCGRITLRSKCPGRKEGHEMVLQMKEPVARDSGSPCSISYKEILANAGVDGSDAAMQRAREKVEAWVETGGLQRMVRVCEV